MRIEERKGGRHTGEMGKETSEREPRKRGLRNTRVKERGGKG